MKLGAEVGLPRLGVDSAFRLLLIEDSSSDSELVLALLETELPNADIQVAANLGDAMSCLSSSHFDVALADLSLPDADGLAVVHAVRTSYPDLALLVLTGRVDGQLALWALAEGAQDYLVKGEHDGPGLATACLHALQRQRTEHEARQYLQLARGLLDAMEAPTCAVNADGCIVAVNSAWLTFCEPPDGEIARWGLGAKYLEACDLEGKPDTLYSKTAREHRDGLEAVLSGKALRHQQEYPRYAAHDERWFSVRIAPAQIDDERGAVISHVDVTEMHRVQEALAHQSLHDSLTGLPNRLLLADRLTQALADGQRRGREVGVAFIDLDRFKRVNDSLGHAAGDDLLLQVSQRLARQMRSVDTLSHYSGDEFVVIWRDLGDPDEARLLSERLVEALKEPFELGEMSLAISASIGVIVGRPSETADELLMAADAAMYDAKRNGGGTVRVFSDTLRRHAEERSATEVALRHALTCSQMVLHYQPVMDLTTGKAVAVEALVRWEHPERGLLAPRHFIPIAESTGLIVELGRWVLEQACLDAASFRGSAEGLDVAVNLSVRQLVQPDVVAHVRQALEKSGLDPRRLLLEVTESAVMDDSEAAALALDALTALGVRIAIDDFGTGYSSLLYLRRYPISALKLDQAFVSGLGVHLNDDAICNNVVSLAHAVGATSIAEGVETREQYAALRAYGCQFAQGFLWSPAVPMADLAEVLLRASEVSADVVATASWPRARHVEVLESAVSEQLESLRRTGASPHTIAAALNRGGARSGSGRLWSAKSVQRYLSTSARRGRPAGFSAPRHSPAVGSLSRHTAHLYADDTDLVSRVSDVLAEALREDRPCRVIATAEHRKALRQALEDKGLALSLRSPLYVERDASELLASFMRDGVPDPGLFEEQVAPLVTNHNNDLAPCAYGEMVDVLWSEGNVVAAIQLEQLWEGLLDNHDFTLLCAYSMEEVGRQCEGDIRLVVRHHGYVSGLVPIDRLPLTGEKPVTGTSHS